MQKENVTPIKRCDAHTLTHQIDRANDLFVNKFFVSFILLFTFISSVTFQSYSLYPVLLFLNGCLRHLLFYFFFYFFVVVLHCISKRWKTQDLNYARRLYSFNQFDDLSPLEVMVLLLSSGHAAPQAHTNHTLDNL